MIIDQVLGEGDLVLQKGDKLAPHPFVNLCLGTALSLLSWGVRVIPTHFKSDHKLFTACRVIVTLDLSILFHTLHRRCKPFNIIRKLVSRGEEAILALITVTLQIYI